MEMIKLVIWDMDDTFWKGTIAEEEVHIHQEHYKILKELLNRGIMHSICSKNDFNQVQSFLSKENLWDLFLFPQISYGAKSQMILTIIDAMQLRAQNILFIDDNVSNLQEVKYSIPLINVAEPEIIPQLLSMKELNGNNDLGQTRLKQYKVLESKYLAKHNHNLTNEEFLFDSNIKVGVFNDSINELTRIHELITRTNQLNFTKNRITEDELKLLLQDADVAHGYVKASDKYGDYGIIGFYALKNNKLLHFCFSCRVLGLSIEQWIYSYLKFPNIQTNIVGGVAVTLDANTTPAWIHYEATSINDNSTKESKKKVPSLIIKGGCDLEQICFYLSGKNIEIVKELTNFQHRDHTEIIRGNLEYPQNVKEYIIDALPFFDNELYDSRLFSKPYDIVVYSVLMNYVQACYKSKDYNETFIAYGDYLEHDEYYKEFKDFGKEFQVFFQEHFEFKGQISDERFIENLQMIRDKLDKNTLLIFLNGSEAEPISSKNLIRVNDHKRMNQLLIEFCTKNENTQVLDVNEFIISSNDLTDNIRHYTRNIYYKITLKLIDIVNLKLNKSYLSTSKIKESTIRIYMSIRKIMSKYRIARFLNEKLKNLSRS